MTELVTNERASHARGEVHICQRCDSALLADPVVLEALMLVVPDRVYVVQRDGEILDSQCPQDVGSRDLVGKNFRDVLTAPVSKQAAYYVDRALRTGQPQHFTFTREGKGEFHEYHVYLSQSGPDHVVALVRDTTFEKLREKEIVEITSREQARIGQDLHDGLGQQLTGISFLSRALEQKLASRGLSEAAEAAEICRLVVQTLSQTRNLARGLFPVELEGNGLVSALKQLGEQVEDLFQITCPVDCHEGFVIQDRTTALHLFRLAQEAISNSVKHGKAKRVSLSLEQLNGSAVLSISDDGIGFRDKSAPGQGLGLRIMNYRAQKIGGTLDVRSAPSGGVHIRCTFPYTAPQPSQDGAEPEVKDIND